MKKKKIIILAALVLLLVGAAAAVFLMRGKGEGDEKPEIKEDPIVEAPVVYELEKNTVVALPVGDTVTVREHRPEEEAPEEESKDKPGDKKTGEAVVNEAAMPGAAKLILQLEREKLQNAKPGAPESDQKPEEGPEVAVQVTYQYEGLAQPMDRIKTYCTMLTDEDFGFVPVDNRVMESTLPSFEESAGSLRLVRPLFPDGDKEAKIPEGEEALLSLEVTWGEEKFSVTIGRIEGGIVEPPEVEPMTLAEAVDYIYSRHPSQLGLPGESMGDYRVYAMDGMVMVGHNPCLHLNVYSIDPKTGTTEIAGQYLIPVSGSFIYRITGGELEELPR